MTAATRKGLIGGLIFTALGVMFLLEALDMYTLSPSTLWPVLFLALGVGVLAGIGDEEPDRPD